MRLCMVMLYYMVHTISLLLFIGDYSVHYDSMYGYGILPLSTPSVYSCLMAITVCIYDSMYDFCILYGLHHQFTNAYWRLQ